MQKLIALGLTLLVFGVCNAQTHLGFETGFVRMHGDVKGAGAEFELSATHYLKSDFTVGLRTNVGYTEGGKNSLLNFMEPIIFLQNQQSVT